ncbi:MAG: DUF1326 domain-containing protein [Planctomycetia bacterium]|nr:DUF1326 domain-containing protein [Planctomycetia bacterium]
MKSLTGLLLAALVLVGILPGVASAQISSSQITGDYLEMRTCEVYTGPCFANADMGVAGREALLAWSIDSGKHNGIDLSGLKVVVAVSANDTLGDGIVTKVDPIRSVVLIDSNATCDQRAALLDFAVAHAGKLAGKVQRVDSAEISLTVDHVDMVADLKAGDEVTLKTRKLKKGDCVCSNEERYYQPLVKIDNSAPAYTLVGKFAGAGLGANWTHLGRSSYLGTFSYEQ